MPFIETLFLLFCGHALADFVLQPAVMGQGKNRNNTIHDKESIVFPHWCYWLTAHSFVHGGVVFLITNSLLLAMLEVVLHWLIDFAKCEGKLNVHQDQAIHISCKVAYAFMV